MRYNMGYFAFCFQSLRHHSIAKSSVSIVSQKMENNRENARCCGSGGGVKSAYGDLSNSIADLRIQEAKETDADLLVSACPFCKLNLSQNSDDLEILDLSEFVLEHLDSANDKEIPSRSDSKEGEIQ